MQESSPRALQSSWPVAGRKVEGIDMSVTYDFDTDRTGLWTLHGAGSCLTRFEADNGAGYTSYLGRPASGHLHVAGRLK